jgi:hypothetical protein
MPIIPLEALEPDPRDMLILNIAQTIEAALANPAEIGVLEVAEGIVAEVEESQCSGLRHVSGSRPSLG